MKSLDATYRRFSSRGVDWASGLMGIGLGLTLALQVGRPALAEYSFWVINRDDETAWSYGPNKGC